MKERFNDLEKIDFLKADDFSERYLNDILMEKIDHLIITSRERYLGIFQFRPSPLTYIKKFEFVENFEFLWNNYTSLYRSLI